MIQCCFHWVSRGDFATRWDEDNAVGASHGENFEETFRKQKYRDIHIARVGIAEREALEARARESVKFSDADLQAKIDYFTFKIERGDYGRPFQPLP